VSPDLGGFVRNEIRCPDTMVDRIVPATTDDDRQHLSETVGIDDLWPVVAEPFTQWVIEDRFSGARPAWDEAGATFVSDVAPFESMKLRMLNGSHSALAYLGYLAGHDTVAEAMDDDALAGFVEGLMADTIPTFDLPSNIDVNAYKTSLLTRFRNRALHHRTWQIAMDGSQKLPQRLLQPALDRLRQGAMPRHIALVVAAWMRFLLGRDELGRGYDISDPLAARLVTLVTDTGENAEAFADALFGVREIFDLTLADHVGFRMEVLNHLRSLLAHGVRWTLTNMTGATP
jgi:fructuronate reductase